MIRVGLVLAREGMWQGGVNYYHNLLSCYQQYPNAALELTVFSDRPAEFARYQCDGLEIHSCPEASVCRLSWSQRGIRKLLGYDRVLLKIMARHRIDLLTHRGIGRQRIMNTLQWQPDLQHKVLPQFFSAKERAHRDSEVAQVRLWDNILLSSYAAANDFRHYYPELDSVQTRILHFCSAAPLSIVPVSREELEAQYPVREPYFYLPNQFWQHKNHAVAVEALRQTPPEIRVICTGPMQDPRDVSYVPALLEQVKKLGLEQRFVCLGAVPYSTVVSLMHHSLAVLQPSLFEGWSTSVEESKAMCKQIILSNIAVHLEQAPERGVYFPPDSPEELAACMKRIYAEFNPTIEQVFVEQRPYLNARNSQTLTRDFAHILKAVSGRRTEDL